ncbi:MAG: metal-dependent hydrolase [bacterium]|nr:metal-dependent hydrolase [bacterium]
MTAVHKLLPRRVRFDLTHSPLHWIPHDPEASYIINTIHLLLPEGELWFCRVYNKVLPQLPAGKLRDDVQGFIRQEAIHARAHENAMETYLRRHGVEFDSYLKKVDFIFNTLLGDHPTGLPDNFITRRLAKNLEPWWLRQRVGAIAAIEHFTCVFGKWVLEAEALDAPNVDPVLLDLFRWHGAEEVEHRHVAHDLHVAMGGSARERQLWGAVLFPGLMTVLGIGSSHMMNQDAGIARETFVRRWLRCDKNGTLPSIKSMFDASRRYLRNDYHPEAEATLALSLEYFAKSPAVQAALREQLLKNPVAA